METPRLEPAEPQRPQILSPCSSGRKSSDSNSPEFEFWMVRNPSFPQPNLLSADELFANGCLLPLHLLHNSGDLPDPNPQAPNQQTTTPNLKSPPQLGPHLSTAATSDSSTTALTASKRWKDIFKKSDRKISSTNKNEDKKKDRKSGPATGAELNINIWPFSRSRSAGNNGNRPRMVAGSTVTRKVSSAPCSRSNSAGESKSRKWPTSPGRGRVHLGRSSPVWLVRRGGSSGKNHEPVVRIAEKGVKREGSETRRNKTAAAAPGGAKARLLTLNVPMCIGYRHHLSCRSDEKTAVGVGVATGGRNNVSGHESGGGGGGGRGGNLFNLRNLFPKKVY